MATPENGASNGNKSSAFLAATENGHALNPVEPVKAETTAADETAPIKAENGAARERRSARIVQLSRGDADDRERLRRRLLDRLMASETRGSITRAANEYAQAGFEFPVEQPVQLQLLEHFDEERARDAIGALATLTDQEAPFKRPILEQRLRRLEEYADEPSTRLAAADLRRAIRS